MTRDEILKLASELGITVEHGVIKRRVELLENFARLVRDAALEEAAVLIELTDLGKLPDSWKLAAATMLSAYAESIRKLKENGK